MKPNTEALVKFLRANVLILREGYITEAINLLDAAATGFVHHDESFWGVLESLVYLNQRMREAPTTESIVDALIHLKELVEYDKSL